jgi:hypothetical protein
MSQFHHLSRELLGISGPTALPHLCSDFTHSGPFGTRRPDLWEAIWLLRRIWSDRFGVPNDFKTANVWQIVKNVNERWSSLVQLLLFIGMGGSRPDRIKSQRSVLCSTIALIFLLFLVWFVFLFLAVFWILLCRRVLIKWRGEKTLVCLYQRDSAGFPGAAASIFPVDDRIRWFSTLLHEILHFSFTFCKVSVLGRRGMNRALLSCRNFQDLIVLLCGCIPINTVTSRRFCSLQCLASEEVFLCWVPSASTHWSGAIKYRDLTPDLPVVFRMFTLSCGKISNKVQRQMDMNNSLYYDRRFLLWQIRCDPDSFRFGHFTQLSFKRSRHQSNQINLNEIALTITSIRALVLCGRIDKGQKPSQSGPSEWSCSFLSGFLSSCVPTLTGQNSFTSWKQLFLPGDLFRPPNHSLPSFLFQGAHLRVIRSRVFSWHTFWRRGNKSAFHFLAKHFLVGRLLGMKFHLNWFTSPSEFLSGFPHAFGDYDRSFTMVSKEFFQITICRWFISTQRFNLDMMTIFTFLVALFINLVEIS